MSVDHNQYRPPMAAVADPQEAPHKRPVAVIIALMIMSIGALLALAGVFPLVVWVRRGDLAPLAMVWPIVRLAVLVAAFVAVARGRQWGRVVLALVTAFGLVSVVQRWISFPPEMFDRMNLLVIVVTALPVLLNLAAVWLLFFPGRSWFARRT